MMDFSVCIVFLLLQSDNCYLQLELLLRVGGGEWVGVGWWGLGGVLLSFFLSPWSG